MRVLLGAKADWTLRNEHGEVAQQSAEFADTEPSVRSPQILADSIITHAAALRLQFLVLGHLVRIKDTQC